jgi:hypothetical protein
MTTPKLISSIDLSLAGPCLPLTTNKAGSARKISMPADRSKKYTQAFVFSACVGVKCDCQHMSNYSKNKTPKTSIKPESFLSGFLFFRLYDENLRVVVSTINNYQLTATH